MDRPTSVDTLKAENRKKGRLRVYFGFAAGVGKTYAMLLEAQELKALGKDVVRSPLNRQSPQLFQFFGNKKILQRSLGIFVGIDFSLCQPIDQLIWLDIDHFQCCLLEECIWDRLFDFDHGCIWRKF